MREESHLDEMRSAIRGDFERLAKRRGEQELLRVSGEEDDSEPAVEEPALEGPPPIEEPAGEEQPRQSRSWLVRLFSP